MVQSCSITAKYSPPYLSSDFMLSRHGGHKITVMLSLSRKCWFANMPKSKLYTKENRLSEGGVFEFPF